MLYSISHHVSCIDYCRCSATCGQLTLTRNTRFLLNIVDTQGEPAVTREAAKGCLWFRYPGPAALQRGGGPVLSSPPGNVQRRRRSCTRSVSKAGHRACGGDVDWGCRDPNGHPETPLARHHHRQLDLQHRGEWTGVLVYRCNVVLYITHTSKQ